MATYHPHDISAVFQAVATWQTDCLVGDGSLFGVTQTWTSDNVEALSQVFAPQIDEGDHAFLSELKAQLQGAGPDPVQLCAEMLWILYLLPVPAHTEPDRKRRLITAVAAWAGTQVDAAHELMQAPLSTGIANPGAAFDKRRWMELAFFLKVLRDLKGKSTSERRNLLAFPWAFGRHLDDLAGEAKPIFTHQLRFLLFPERFEAIFSRGEKRRIVSAFLQIPAKETQTWSTTALDRELLKIRNEQAAKHATQELSFYTDPLLSERKALEKAQAEAAAHPGHTRTVAETDKAGDAQAASAGDRTNSETKAAPVEHPEPQSQKPEPQLEPSKPELTISELLTDTVVEFTEPLEIDNVVDPDSVLGSAGDGEIILETLEPGPPRSPEAAPATANAVQPSAAQRAPATSAAARATPPPAGTTSPPAAPNQADDGVAPPLNQILVGAPGTGKTHQAVARAVAICDSAHSAPSQTLQRFRTLMAEGRIQLLSLHPGYGYADLIEGLRPSSSPPASKAGELGSGSNLQPGVMKRLASAARSANQQPARGPRLDASQAIWKISLGEAPVDERLFQQAIHGGFITLGCGGDIDFSGCESREEIFQQLARAQPELTIGDPSVSALHYFRSGMQANDLVVVSDGPTRIRAVGRICSPYQHTNAELTPHHRQLRSVEWLAVFKPSVSHQRIATTQFSKRTLYKLDCAVLNLEALEALASPHKAEGPENYVLILDEMHRADIAACLGEAITLLDADKREGEPGELAVTLPLSGEPFSLPPNLYLIGTMNVEPAQAGMDLGLQRRFDIERLLPDPTLVRGADQLGNIRDGADNAIDLRALLETLNERLRQDRGPGALVGHAYLMDVTTTAELQHAVDRRLLPALEAQLPDGIAEIRTIVTDLVRDCLAPSTDSAPNSRSLQ